MSSKKVEQSDFFSEDLRLKQARTGQDLMKASVLMSKIIEIHWGYFHVELSMTSADPSPLDVVKGLFKLHGVQREPRAVGQALTTAKLKMLWRPLCLFALWPSHSFPNWLEMLESQTLNEADQAGARLDQREGSFWIGSEWASRLWTASDIKEDIAPPFGSFKMLQAHLNAFTTCRNHFEETRY